MKYINYEMGNKDAWVCICGNTPSDDGFYPCDPFGIEVEPDHNWNGQLYICHQCKIIISQAKLDKYGLLEIVGKI